MKKSTNIIVLFIATTIIILQFFYTSPIYAVQIDQNQGISSLANGEFHLRQAIIQSDAARRQDHLSRAERYFSDARDTYRSMNNDFRRRAYFGLVEVNRVQGEFIEALRICNSEVFSIIPAVYWRYKLRGMVHYDRNNWDRAENDLRQAINVDSTDVESGYYLADIYLRMGKSKLNQRNYPNSNDYITKTNHLLTKFVNDTRFSSIHTRRDTLRHNLVNKLIDTLEKVHDNDELKKIIYDHVSKNDSIGIHDYLEAMKFWGQDQIALAIEELKSSKKTHSIFVSERIDKFYKNIQNIAKIKFDKAIKFKNAGREYDDSVKVYLNIVFEIDTSNIYINRGLVLEKKLPQKNILKSPNCIWIMVAYQTV